MELRQSELRPDPVVAGSIYVPSQPAFHAAPKWGWPTQAPVWVAVQPALVRPPAEPRGRYDGGADHLPRFAAKALRKGTWAPAATGNDARAAAPPGA